MLTVVVQYLNGLPTGLATVILAALPITELRLAIPVAINIWLLRPPDAFVLAVIGNIIPFFPLFFGLQFVRTLSLKHCPWLTHIIDSQLARAQKKVEKKYEQYGALALFLFTAIPLPFTGLWTATLAAVALKIPCKYAILGIGIGVVVSGLIVTILSVGADWF